MHLGSLICCLLKSFIYLMNFLYFQRSYIRCTHIMRVLFSVFCMSIHWRNPPQLTLYATDNSTFTFYFKYFLRILCTFYLSTFCLQYTFYSYSSRFIVNYFYFYSSTNSKSFRHHCMVHIGVIETCKLFMYIIKRQFFSMSRICNEKCSKPKIFLAFLSKLLCFSFIL